MFRKFLNFYKTSSPIAPLEISDEAKENSTLVTIPMNGYAESLNAAAAATIIMWEMMR